MRQGGIVPRLLREVEERVGVTAVRTSRLSALEETAQDARTVRRELDLLAYGTLDYFSGRSQDLTPEARRMLAQKARVVWMKDPMAGAAVDLKNDFVLGKGITRPKAKDEQVQAVLDDFWDDDNNKRILTTHAALMALNTDFELQSNVFVLAFDDGEDGKVKLSLLEHDAVRNVVKHPEDRFCHLWYVAEQRREEWDFDHDAPYPATRPSIRDMQVLYYEHWSNYRSKAEEAEKAGIAPPLRPPEQKIGVGRVYHMSDNRTTEMAFGHPRMDRVLRWYSAYNTFMESRVDMMKAAAAIVMKRKVKGSPSQVVRQATKALSRSGDLAVDATELPERGAKVVTENEEVTHEAFKLDSGAANAAQDASQLRAQVSAATRWPQTYYGDMQNGSLSTSQSLELPVLKGVESGQQRIEDLVNWGCDLAIERAIDVGRLSRELTDAERKKRDEDAAPDAATADVAGQGPPTMNAATGLGLTAAHEDKSSDEEELERDLSYEFSLPNPLRRALGDIILAIQNIARTFDPNNTNPELSRVLLLVALTELEVGDPAEIVERVFPPGYVDPAVAAQQAAQAAPADPFGEFGPDAGAVGQDGQRHGPGNAYGVPQQATAPEQMQQAWYMPPEDRALLAKRIDDVAGLWEATVGEAADQALAALAGTNGHG